jgi:peptide/nickel transport system ATP-binding protein
MNYSLEIKKNRRTLVRIDHLPIRERGINFLFGESGIGKTMMARAIYGLLDAEEFDISINNRPYALYLQSREYQNIKLYGFFVFQEPSSHLNPVLTLRQQIREGSLVQSNSEPEILAGLWPGKNPEQLNPILEIYPRPYRPSGGEKQRILLTMAFKKIDWYLQQTDPPETLFIFDEPTGNLDNAHRNLFLRYLLEKYLHRNFTILFITHDYSIIGEIVQNYPDLMTRISFSDLLLTDHGLKQENFSAQRYIDWNNGIHLSAMPGRVSEPLLRLENPVTIFDRELVISKDVLGKQQIPLQIYPGEMVYLKAGSGVGKTTLAKCLLGLLQSQHLQLKIEDMILTERTDLAGWQRKIWGKKVTMVFQHADEALNLNARVKNVFAGLPLPVRMDEPRLIRQLQWIFDGPVGTDFLNRKVMTLSGGQKQRLNLLRSLVLDTDLIILDEPLNGLGFDSIQKVIDLTQEKQHAGKGILLISHNEDIFDKLIPPESRYYLSVTP